MYGVAELDLQGKLHQYSRSLSLRQQTRQRECLLGTSPVIVSLRIRSGGNIWFRIYVAIVDILQIQQKVSYLCHCCHFLNWDGYIARCL